MIRPTRVLPLGVCLLLLTGLAAPSQADQIDLSLNLIYSTPTQPELGGTWQVVAKSDQSGIAGVSFTLLNINTDVVSGLPTGRVNGSSSDNAGFQLFEVNVDTEDPGDPTSIVAAQLPNPPNTGDQGLFYGVGTLMNGSPEYPTRPLATTNAIGSSLNSLNPATLSNIPWATGDVFGDTDWDTAAIVATGSFLPAGSDPSDLPSFTAASGQVFTSLGTASTPGALSDSLSTMISTIVRTNEPSLPDYNNDGFIDAADYALWRNTFGQSVTPGTGADGNVNGVIDQADYLFWRDNYGVPVPGAGSGSFAAVPTPGSSCLMLLAAGLGIGFRPRKAAASGITGEIRKKREYRQKLLDTPETPSHNASS